jgi:hypothetical protein
MISVRTLGNYNRYIRWALNSARPRHNGPGCRSDPPQTPGVITQSYGYTVTLAARSLPYATGYHERAKYSHIVRRVYLAWRGGVIVGAAVHYWCGNSSYDVAMTDEPTREVCFMCQARYARFGP